MSNLFNTFKEAIDTATTNWNRYKEKENAYKGKVNKVYDDLAALIKKLKACIDKLKELQGDYAAYISRITKIREGMQMMLDAQIGQIQRNTDKNCDAKIKELLEKFQGFVSQIGVWEGDANRFADLLKTLDDEIKRLCNKADRIVAQNDDNRTNLDEELRKVEEKLNPGGGASKEDIGFVQRQVDALERGDGQAAEEIARERRRSPQSSREQKAEERAIARLAKARNRRSSESGRLPGYDQGGGWQTPQKLESISRYSPIRRVERKKKKKNKNNKKNTKKNKKNKRKKYRKNQTKRRGKKRN